MTEGARPGVARRTVVAGVLAGVLPAAGCGIRLEDDAPRVPLVPTRTPVPAEAELVALTRDTAALAELAATVAGALAADLATLHRRQHSVLRSTLLAEGCRPPTSTRPPRPRARVRHPRVGVVGLACRAATARAALARDEGASAATAATFAGVAATCAPPSRPCTPSGTPRRRSSPDARPRCPSTRSAGRRVEALAGSTSAAIYFLEVVAAAPPGASALAPMPPCWPCTTCCADQTAGGAVPDDSLGHPLPFAVDDRTAAARLARTTLTTLRASYGEQLAPIVASDGGAGLAALTRWLGTVEVEAHRWGVALAPFPGLT